MAGMHYRAFWYRIVQWFSGVFAWKHPVKPVASVSEIPERLSWGQNYKADRRGSDRFYHPRRIQLRIDKDVRIGDCEDHAGYWIACLLKSGLAKRAWLGAVFFVRDGIQGHAVCLYEDRAGQFWWCDYGMPRPFTPQADTHGDVDGVGYAWAPEVARAFGASALHRAELYGISGLKRTDALDFDFRRVHNRRLSAELSAQP